MKVLIAAELSERYGPALDELISMNQRDASAMRTAFPPGDTESQDLCNDIWSYRRDLLAATSRPSGSARRRSSA